MQPDWCGSVCLNEFAQASGVVIVSVGDENSVNFFNAAEILPGTIFHLFHIPCKSSACTGVYEEILPLRGLKQKTQPVLAGKSAAGTGPVSPSMLLVRFLRRKVVYENVQFHII